LDFECYNMVHFLFVVLLPTLLPQLKLNESLLDTRHTPALVEHRALEIQLTT